MAQILDKQGLQHYANKMCNADNRKVGSKNLPTALNEMDIAIDGFKTLFETEYGTPVNMELENNENVFSIGTGTNINKKDDVENSFTDLKIGGNTLVNLMPKITSGDYIQLNATTNWVTSPYHSTGKRLKPNTKYTVILDVHANSLSSTNNFHVNIDHNNAMAFTEKWAVNSLGRHVKLFTTKAELLDNMLAPRTQIETAEEGKYVRYSIILLEGDWTNKPLPQYFNEMLSVGDITNNNIKLISQPNKPNLLKTNFTIPTSKSFVGYPIAHEMEIIKDSSVGSGQYLKATIAEDAANGAGVYTSLYKRLEQNKTYTWSAYIKTSTDKVIRCGQEQNGIININSTTEWKRFSHTFVANTRNYTAFIFYIQNAKQNDILYMHSLKIEEGDLSDWCPNNEEILNNVATDNLKYDSKIIELNDPLRGLPNGIKDTIEKINGEWKIIRRCGQDTLNGNSLTSFSVGSASNSSAGEKVGRMNFLLNKAKWSVDKNNTIVLCDKFSFMNFHASAGGSVERNREAICFHSNNSKELNLHILLSRLSEQTTAAAKTWLNTNPITVVYELENYIIEDIKPITLQCWKNGTISLAEEVIPAETKHTVALNKSAQIQKNIEELTLLRNRVEALEKQYNNSTLNQAYELELLRLDMELDNIV